jgi:hypothetical protein
MAEHEVEPVPGLPERLPEGEHILWQGAPRWQSVLRNVFYAPYLTGYFGLLLAWRFAAILHDGGSVGQATVALLTVLPIPITAILLLVLLSWLVQRTTLYTVTNRRVVMRVGIALSITFNIPYRLIESVGMRRNGDDSGDIALQMSGPDSIAYMHLWPHARPWHFSQPQPQFRAVKDPGVIAEMIANAIKTTEKQQADAAKQAIDRGGNVSQAAPSLVTTQ